MAREESHKHESALHKLVHKLGAHRHSPAEEGHPEHEHAQHPEHEHAEHAEHVEHAREHVQHAKEHAHEHVQHAREHAHEHVQHAKENVHHAAEVVAKHLQAETHRYMVHFPPHPAREDDPHYKDFDHYHQKTRATARCYIGERIGFHDCRDEQGKPCPAPGGSGEQPSLELHHSHVEFSLQNGVSLEALEKDYPGISKKEQIGEWVESEANFRWLCVFHHRGPAGAHTASHSDFEASQYVLGLISAEPDAAPKADSKK
jgi:hypothetical protein